MNLHWLCDNKAEVVANKRKNRGGKHCCTLVTVDATGDAVSLSCFEQSAES
jgi:hypothetical protein